MSDNKPKTPRELLHEERTIAVKPVVVEALRRRHAALVAEREEHTGKKGRPGSSPPILQAALILSGVLVLEKKYSKTRVHIEDSTLKGNGLTKNDIERGDKLLVECGFVVKERAGYKGAKHYVADHEAIAEQVPDLLGMLLVGAPPGASPVSDTASETGTLEGDEEDAPVSGTSVGNTIPTLRRKQDSGTASETHPLCTSYELASETIDRRARSRESNGGSRATGQRPIDGGKNSVKKRKVKDDKKATLDDYEESVRRIPEADIADADRRFGVEWSSKLGDIDEGDLARLACSVGNADRGRMGIAAKNCAQKLAADGVDLPWRYMLRSAHTLILKRTKRTDQKLNPAGKAANPASADAPTSTMAESSSLGSSGLQEELAALVAEIGADERLADADAVSGEDGERLVVARNARHAGQLRQRYGPRLEGAGWRVVTPEEMPSAAKADDGEHREDAGEVA